MLQHPANLTHNPPHQTGNLKTTARNNTGSNHCIILLSSWWWALWCPKHVEQAIRSAIKTSVASSGILFPHINDDARSKSHKISVLLCINCVSLLLVKFQNKPWNLPQMPSTVICPTTRPHYNVVCCFHYCGIRRNQKLIATQINFRRFKIWSQYLQEGLHCGVWCIYP